MTVAERSWPRKRYRRARVEATAPPEAAREEEKRSFALSVGAVGGDGGRWRRREPSAGQNLAFRKNCPYCCNFPINPQVRLLVG